MKNERFGKKEKHHPKTNQQWEPWHQIPYKSQWNGSPDYLVFRPLRTLHNRLMRQWRRRGNEAGRRTANTIRIYCWHVWCENVMKKPHYFVLVTCVHHFRTQYSFYQAFESRCLCMCQQERNLKSEVEYQCCESGSFLRCCCKVWF